MNGDPQQNISFAEFELDAAHRRLFRSGEPLSLYAKTFDLLTFLLAKNGQVVTKDEILEAVWAGQFVEEANLSVQISALRKVLGEKKNEPRFLITVPGKGYKFVADLQNGNSEIVIEKRSVSRFVVDEETEVPTAGFPIASLETVNKKQRKNDKRHGARVFLAVGGITLILALGIVGFWLFDGTQENRGLAVPIIAAEKQPSIRRLTTKGRINLAVLSPDGKFFAYTLVEKGSYQTELRLGQTNGSSDVRLMPAADDVAYHPAGFSVDGNWLYYTTSEARKFVGALYKMPVLGGVPQKILSDVSIYPALSHDEKQVAFVRNDGEQKRSALVIANTDGTGEREIAVRPYAQSFVPISFSWSADGALIAFGSGGAKGGSYEIFTANVSDGDITQLTALDWNEIARLDWLKDGSGLLAVARDKDSTASRQIWQIDYPAGTARKITRDLSQYGSALSLSADSTAFAVVQVQAESNIWLAPAFDLKEARQITFGSIGRQDGWWGLDWTSDGRIVYTTRIDQSLTLWIMDADGANTRQLTPIGFEDSRPSVTADGSFIVFQSNRSGTMEIWRVGTDGSNMAQLTTDGGNSTPSITPDGKWVVYQHKVGSENSVWRVQITGGEAVRITDSESTSPRVSPDGRLIACGYLMDGKMKLGVVGIEGGGPLKLFDVPQTHNFDNSAIKWSPDGSFISYRDWSNGVWSQSVDGGEPVRLKGLPAEKLYAYGWSRDGRQFGFTRGREVRDVVLISDFR